MTEAFFAGEPLAMIAKKNGFRTSTGQSDQKGSRGKVEEVTILGSRVAVSGTNEKEKKSIHGRSTFTQV